MGGVVWAGENPDLYTRETVGGKGLNLLRLFALARQTGLFEVPNFFIIPVDAKHVFVAGDFNSSDRVAYEGGDVEAAFGGLNKPVIERSSSPLEDGILASFAGMFSSWHNIADSDTLLRRANNIYKSANYEGTQRYAERMGISFSNAMAIIVQEQVTGAAEWGVIQLESREAITESTVKDGSKSRHETDYQFLDEIFPKGYRWEIKPGQEPRDWLSEGEFHYATYCAREAKNKLGLEGIVQVEFLLVPGTLPKLVQIRQLPAAKSYAAFLDMDVPKGVPCLESEVCNGVAGELVLPAYVTFSHSNFSMIRQQVLVGNYETAAGEPTVGELVMNHDFSEFLSLSSLELLSGLGAAFPLYVDVWRKGNSLFSDYILVCDKLDASIAEMSEVTANKRAIITCCEALQTSHAMTVARDLGIMAMGVQGEIRDQNYFFNQVKTGDLVHMKSDGKRAVAYIEKNRQHDPYSR